MNVIFRADANAQIGVGHLMRCLALAQAWQDVKGHPIFVMAAESSAAVTRLKSKGIEIVHLSTQPGAIDDAIQTAHLARERDVTWVVVDGYHFDAAYQKSIKDAGLKLLFIDDHGHAEHYFADMLLNQNLHANEALYVNREPYTRLLLGTRYVLLRKEFLKWCEYRREIPNKAKKILVTMGGGDPNNLTTKVINALKKLADSDLAVKIIIGPSNPHIESLQNALLLAPCSMRIIQNIENMADLMAWADMAISAGGTTSWEIAFMGLPNLVIATADNQRPVAEQLQEVGASEYLGWHKSLSVSELARKLTTLLTTRRVRMQMAQKAQEVVDGKGTDRVLMHIHRKKLGLRPVRKEDCRLLWEWTSAPDVRAVSFSSEPIPRDEHVKWFNSKLTDSQCIFYISTNGKGTPIGQIRFDSEENEARVSVSVDPKFRGKGYGNAMIWLASQEVFNVSDVTVIHAHVKKDNDSSVRAFEKAGFTVAGTEKVHGHQAIHLVLQK